MILYETKWGRVLVFTNDLNSLLSGHKLFEKNKPFDSYYSVLSVELDNPLFKRKRHIHGITRFAKVLVREISILFFDLLCDDLIKRNYTFVFPTHSSIKMRCGARDNRNNPNYKYNIKTSGRDYALLFFRKHVINNLGAFHHATFIGVKREKFKKEIDNGHIYE